MLPAIHYFIIQHNLCNMKGLLVVSLCFAAVCLVSSNDADKESLDECMKKYNVTKEDMVKVKNGGAPTENDMCVMGCVGNKLGDEAKLQEAMNKVGELTDSQKTKVIECISKVDKSDDCKTGAEAVDCVKKTMMTA